MRILFLDDDGLRHDRFRSMVAPSHSVRYVWTAEEAIEALLTDSFDIACLDHDLGGKQFVPSEGAEATGYTVAKAIAEMDRKPAQVIVHSFNAVGAQNMVECLTAAGVNAVRLLFGTFEVPA